MPENLKSSFTILNIQPTEQEGHQVFRHPDFFGTAAKETAAGEKERRPSFVQGIT